MSSVIVFGPTGQIGSAAAKMAAEHGAKVWLAMRDTSKTIPGLDSTAGTFERVQADVSKPETVEKAVKTSGAKRAFLYLVHGLEDHMKSSFEALKSGGIEFVVFLSSFTVHVHEPLRDIPSSEAIPYIHAQAEASLDDVFGDDHYVAMRPGAFVTNLNEYKKGIAAGEVVHHGGVFEQDNIDPSDIGRVAGTVLVKGALNGQKKIYVYGPKIRTIDDSIRYIGKLLDNDVKITALTDEQGYKKYTDGGMPSFFADYMVRVRNSAGPDKGAGERFPRYDEGVANVKLYTGRDSTSLDDWVKANAEEFE